MVTKCCSKVHILNRLGSDERALLDISKRLRLVSSETMRSISAFSFARRVVSQTLRDNSDFSRKGCHVCYCFGRKRDVRSAIGFLGGRCKIKKESSVLAKANVNRRRSKGKLGLRQKCKRSSPGVLLG